jgi:hypothetical protein
MATLQQIEQYTKSYAGSREILHNEVQTLTDAINDLKKKAIPRIKTAVNETKVRQDKLNAAIAESPDLFIKPRSITLYGIKVGFQKAKGKISWQDATAVVKALKRLLPDSWGTYVKVTEKPLKKPLESLPAADLKKCGILVKDDVDEVLIKCTDSDIDKLVEALLNPKKDEEEED